MKLSDYQREAARTLSPDDAPSASLSCLGLGLTGEAGEVADLLKKGIHHGHGLDPAKVSKELGDVLWYVAGLATKLGLSLDDIAEGNLAKLRARYPEGFSQAASIARVDVKEDAA